MATKKKTSSFALAQRFGRALMLPIAALPAAGLLLRIGQPDMLGADGAAKYLGEWLIPVADVLAQAGGAIFSNLPILFAIGIAIGMARKADGSTALSAFVGYIVLTGVFTSLAPLVWELWKSTLGLGKMPEDFKINYGVLGGIVIGILAAKLYEKYYRIKLPMYLAFFGGRRFVPIITSFFSILTGVGMAIIYPIFDKIINKGLGGFIMEHGANPGTGFAFGTTNRLLIPVGLHHLLNSIPWFQLGDCINAKGEVVHGDLNCFFQGVDGTAAWTGSFMTGFFPIMMFALPGAAYAIYRTSKPEKRKLTGGIMLSVALTAFLTGITEPLEYTFAYVAFPLYIVHAVLTGTSLALVNALGIKDGFSFSAGLFDYLLNFGRAAQLSGGAGKVLLLIPIGLVYAVIYYFIFYYAITKFDLRTPGREDEDGEGGATISVFDEAQQAAADSTGKTTAIQEGRV